jgi:serine/threonine protein kinase
MAVKFPDSLRWKQGRQLGEGGQAPVYLATDKQGEFAGEYALKALPSHKPAKAYERFAREIEAIKAVDHRNIVRIIDHSAADDGFQFYVMDYIDVTSIKFLYQM